MASKILVKLTTKQFTALRDAGCNGDIDRAHLWLANWMRRGLSFRSVTATRFHILGTKAAFRDLIDAIRESPAYSQRRSNSPLDTAVEALFAAAGL